MWGWSFGKIFLKKQGFAENQNCRQNKPGSLGMRFSWLILNETWYVKIPAYPFHFFIFPKTILLLTPKFLAVCRTAVPYSMSNLLFSFPSFYNKTNCHQYSCSCADELRNMPIGHSCIPYPNLFMETFRKEQSYIPVIPLDNR